MRRLLLISAALAAVAGPGWAQVETTSSGPDRTAVVIYRDRPVDTVRLIERSRDPYERLDQEGLALIIETRTVDLPAGEAVIRLKGVAAGIVPQTATMSGLPTQVLERNTDFDLISPGSLFDRSVGEVVQVERLNRQTGEISQHAAVIRSGAQGPVLEIDGRFEPLDCTGQTQRILFDRVPDGLSDQPVLSVRTRSATAGRYTVTLAYLATGLQWSADYVARLSPDGRSLDLTGWITLANFGGSSFQDAPVQVVAGNLNRTDDSVPVEPVLVERGHGCWPMDTTTRGLIPIPPLPIPASPVAPSDEYFYAAKRSNEADGEVMEVVVTGSRVVQLGELGDYKIYTLPEPTDVNARQTKQVQFLRREDVRFTRFYRFHAQGEGEPTARLLLRLRNDERHGLGLPLPGGGLSLIEARDGRPLLAGQVRVEDRAVDQTFELDLEEAAGVTLTLERLDTEWDYDEPTGFSRRSFVATVMNDKPFPVEIELIPEDFDQSDFRVDRSDVRPVTTEAGTPAFRFVVPARGSRVFNYRTEYRY